MQRILVVGPAWVGDMVIAHSLVRLLGQRHAGAEIDVVAPPWSNPLLERMPEVADSIEMPLGHGQFGWPTRRRIGRSLRIRHYDWAIVLPRSFKSALLPFHAAIPLRTGYRSEWRGALLTDARRLDRERLDQTVKRFVALGLPADAELPEVLPEPRFSVDADRQQTWRETLAIREEQRVVALLPGAEYGPAKCWPLEYYGRLASMLIEAGVAVWVIGSERDREAGVVICDHAAAVRNLCGQTTLSDAVDLLAMADVAVSNDSGLMHIAAAVGTRVVALYGSSSPANTPPLTQAREVLYLDLGCSPCFARSCPLGHLACLTGITPERVFALTRGGLAQ